MMDFGTAFVGVGVLGLLAGIAGRLIFALIVWLVGKWIIGVVINMLSGSRGMEKIDATVRTFLFSFLRIGLYAVLLVSIIGILGVPMASVVAVLASAGVAVGLAMQGALSNLAGGIMLLAFKPFRVGDYVDAAGVSGVVKEVTLVYTVIMTPDNKRITVPNGTLMNANVVNYSTEPQRRVDLQFSCAKSEDPKRIQELLMEAIRSNEKILSTPDAPFARLSGGTNEAMEFTVRVWGQSEDYWDIYFDLIEKVTEKFAENGVKTPARRVVTKAE